MNPVNLGGHHFWKQYIFEREGLELAKDSMKDN